MKKLFRLLVVAALLFPQIAYAQQGFTRQTFHDAEKKHLKEVYQVRDTVRNIIHGRYISYYGSGNVESKGQFTNNETSGIWEFYYETGKVKMRGNLLKGANDGFWEYFFENGQKSMEGIIHGKNREGEWKSYYENGQIKEVGSYLNSKRVGLWKNYFEDGSLKGEIEYTNDFGRYTEYYHSGKIFAEGPKSGARNVGHWRMFHENGELQSEGDFTNGKKQGQWTHYFSSGKVSARGNYENDEPVNVWTNYYEDGTISNSGEYRLGQKHGLWKAYNPDGTLKSETSFEKGSGDFREYYAGGKLKTKGRIVEGKREGKWEFFAEDGKQEGVCEYNKDKGIYYGYFPDGNLQTKGAMEGELKTGRWEIYKNDGSLSGYYHPYYDNRKLGREITALASRNTVSRSSSPRARRTYFDERSNEFKGVIVATNPLWVVAGRIPLGIEFYAQERLGHEFEFIGVRNPFFKGDDNIAAGKQFQRGYSVSIKQKFYNSMNANMWYFGQEIRFTNLGHFVNQPLIQNPDNLFTFNAVEQRIQWGVLLGYRVMKRNNVQGFTIDAFIAGDIGYRNFDVDPNFETYFQDLNRSNFAATFHFGFNLGNVFSFR